MILPMATKSKKKKPSKKTSKKPSKKKTSGKKAAPAKRARSKTRRAAAKAKAKPRPKKKAPRRRRDATGHLDPSYARDLRRMSRENQEHDDDRAFLVGERANDALAQELGTEFVETVTSGEDEGVELRDQTVPEERGGPFVTTPAAKEFADEPDESNPPDATREPFPKS
jgi:hypothetical protein